MVFTSYNISPFQESKITLRVLLATLKKHPIDVVNNKSYVHPTSNTDKNGTILDQSVQSHEHECLA